MSRKVTQPPVATAIPLLTIKANGGQEVRMQPLPNGRYRVMFGRTFAGELVRRDLDDWRIVRAFCPDERLGSRLEEVTDSERYVIADDAAFDLIREFGYSVERCQVSFRDAVTHDMDLSPERKRELLAMCDEEGIA